MLNSIPPNSIPPKPPEFLRHFLRQIIIGGSVVLLLFFVWSAAEARKKTSDQVVDWLPKNTEELKTYRERYHRHFFEGEYLMVSWKGCSIYDERLDILSEKLAAPPDTPLTLIPLNQIAPNQISQPDTDTSAAALSDSAPSQAPLPQVPLSSAKTSSEGTPYYFARCMTTRSVMAMLADEYPLMTESAIKSRLTGWLLGQDQESACLVLLPSPPAWRGNEAVAVRFLMKTIEEVTGLPPSDIYIAGTGIDSVAISEVSQISQRTLVPFFLLFSLLLLLCCLRHFFAAFLVFWAAIINEEMAGSLLYWCGAHVDSISMLNSSLIYVLTISGSVHLINYYRETLAEMPPGKEYEAPLQTFYKAILPCSLAAFTTIMGMGSLAVSAMIPIKTFGIYSSLALFLGTIWFFLYILSVLQEFPIKRWFPKTSALSSHSETSGFSDESDVSKMVFWERFGMNVYKSRILITFLTFILIGFFAFGIAELKTSITFHGLLPEKTKVLQDYQMLEEQIGGLIPIEVVVQFPKEKNSTEKNSDDAVDDHAEGRKILSQIHFLESLVDELWQTESVDTVISVLNFLPSLPSQNGRGMRDVSRRTAMERRLPQSKDRLREVRFFDTQDGDDADAGNYWRICLRVSTQNQINYAMMIDDVKKRLEKVRQAVMRSSASEEINVENIRFDVTGGVPLVHRAQELLLWDLINSFVTAFGLIALTMIVVLRGVVRGLLAMIPNIFPCMIVFGTLGLCGIPVDMGSMMTASVALGISVDGTLHLMTWVNLGFQRGRDRKKAVFYALHRCCTALFQTATICGVGMLVFGLSGFIPVSRFAVLLCIILMASLAGTVIVLPAILFSPLGIFFESKQDRR